jgi:hypothetical protein
MYETLTWGLRHTAPVKGIRLAITPDSRHIAVGNYGSGLVKVYDWRKPDGPPGDTRSPDDLWQSLGSLEAATAFRAVSELAESPAAAVAMIGKRLKPIRAPDEAEIARLIAGLRANDFQARENASAAIAAIGVGAEPALRRVVATSDSPEVRARAGRLLSALTRHTSTERLRFARAVEVLEYCNTPAATAVLRELSSGLRLLPETEEARAALARIGAGGSRP